MTKKIKFVITRLVFSNSKCTKIRFRPAGAQSAGGAYDALPDHLVGWGGGYPLSIPLPLDAFDRRLELGASIHMPPSTQNPGYASDWITYIIQTTFVFGRPGPKYMHNQSRPVAKCCAFIN